MIVLIIGCAHEAPVRALPPQTKPVISKPGPKKPIREENSTETQALIDQEAAEQEYKPEPPAGATAECLDDTFSYSTNRKNACTGHRGVKRWLGLGTGR